MDAVTRCAKVGAAFDRVFTDHAKACHEAKTVVEKLAIDTKPKLRYEPSDPWSKRICGYCLVITFNCWRLPINNIALASKSAESSSRWPCLSEILGYTWSLSTFFCSSDAKGIFQSSMVEIRRIRRESGFWQDRGQLVDELASPSTYR